MRKLHSTEVGRKTEEFVGKIKNQPIPFEIEYRYAQGTETKEGYFARLGKERHRDMEKGFTQIGPQQDDFDIRWNSRLLRTYGSTGQCRAAAICLKMAQLELSRKKNHGEHNIIALVDDVTGELDAGTREAFFDTIGHADQAFFTFTEAPAGPFFEKSQFYHVSDGIVRVE
jgi:DNA replication and repair protein RecF